MAKRPYLIEYRLVQSTDNLFATQLFSLEWEEFHAYETERGRDDALNSFRNKFKFLEFRPAQLHERTK